MNRKQKNFYNFFSQNSRMINWKNILLASLCYTLTQAGDGNVIIGNGNCAYGNQNNMKGDRNRAIGDKNHMEGNRNKLYGSENTMRGNDNIHVGSFGKVRGSNDWVFGDHKNVQNSNVHMFSKKPNIWNVFDSDLQSSSKSSSSQTGKTKQNRFVPGKGNRKFCNGNQ